MGRNDEGGGGLPVCDTLEVSRIGHHSKGGGLQGTAQIQTYLADNDAPQLWARQALQMSHAIV